MLKYFTIRNLGFLLFSIAIISHFYIDFSQGDYIKGSEFRKFYVFTGRNIVQILIGLSFACFSIKWFSVIPIGWSLYNLENIYYRIVTGSVYELDNWIVSVSCIFFVCIVNLITWKR